MAIAGYKVPPGFNLGIYHRQERDGAVFTYQAGKVADLQGKLITGFNHLSVALKRYRGVQAWFCAWLSRVPDSRDSSFAESRRDNSLAGLRTERESVVGLMVQILKAGAEPLPPDSDLDDDVSKALGTDVLLCEAAIDAAGGNDAVQCFRVSAETFITEEITRKSPILLADFDAYCAGQQQRAAQRAAEAQERADKETQEVSQGPSVHCSKVAPKRKNEADLLDQEEVHNAEQAKLKAAKKTRLGRS